MPAAKNLSAAEAKAAVIELITRGSRVADAMASVGRAEKTYENWRAQDKDFAAAIDRAREGLENARKRGVSNDNYNLSFAEWRKRFLGQDTYPHQQAWIDLIENGDYTPRSGEEFTKADPNRIIFNVPPFHGKALDLDTEVPTPHGFRTVGGLRVGDEVFGLDGKPTRVTAKSEVFLKPCFEVVVNSGERFVASEDHLWTVHRGKGSALDTLTTRQLYDAGGAFRLPAHGDLVCDQIDYILDPYLLGVWLGDGSTSDGQVTSADPEVIDAFRDAGFTVVRYEAKTKGRASQYNILGLFPVLSELGIRGRKHIPAGYLLGSYGQRQALLQGLMDTDGTCSPAGQASFTNKNEDIARGVLYLAASLGLRPSIREGRATLGGVDCGPKWTVTFTPGDTPVFRLRRKLRRQTIEAKRRGGNLRRIVAVRPVDAVRTQCITVDNDSRTFLIGRSLVPTHNSQTLTIEYATYRICMNPNIRIIIVSKRIDQARKFLYSIKQRLTSNQWAALQGAYAPEGGFKPDRDSGTWGADRIYVAGIDSGEKDPTVEALGIGGQIYGSRADLIIMDDCVVNSNAAQYEAQITWLESEVENRAFDGKILIIGTRLATTDLYSELPKGERYLSGRSPWTVLRQPAVLEYSEDPKDWKTLWPRTTRPMETGQQPGEDGLYEAWDGPRLARVRDSKPPKVWSLVYQQQDVAEDAVFNPKCVMGSVERRRKPGPLHAGGWGHPRNGLEGQYVIGSMDPAMAGDTFTLVGAVDRITKMRRVMNAWVQGSPTPDYIRNMIKSVTEEYSVNEWVIEQNAFQLFLIYDPEVQDFCRNRGVRITPHYTSRNKQDPDFGVASVAPLFGGLYATQAGGRMDHDGKNLIELPDPDYSVGVKTLIEELVAWQPGKLGKQLRQDGPMALWFFELRARAVLLGTSGGGRPANFVDNPYLSRGDRRQQIVVPMDIYRQRALA